MTATKDNAKPTPGPWFYVPVLDTANLQTESGAIIAGTYTSDYNQATDAANMRLCAEAGTVYHETGLTPRQLAEQRAELLATLDSIMNHAADFALDDAEACNSIHVIARAAIARCKETTA